MDKICADSATRPCRVAILGLDDCYLSSAAGFADVLQVANAHLRRQYGDAVQGFAWRFVADGPVTACNGLPLACGPLEDTAFDLVCVPAVHYHGRAHFIARLESWRVQGAWLVAQWQRGAVLAANCTASFVLAESGLLNGRVATTTWWLERLFRSRYPGVRLQAREVVCEDERVCTAGASASWLLQAVRMVEHFRGAAIATRTAQAVLVDLAQTTQPFLAPPAEHGIDDPLVVRAQHWLHAHLAQPVRLAALAEALAVSERTLLRRFNAALGCSPIVWLQQLRINTAQRVLEGSGASVEAVARQVGYQDASAFSRLFRAQTGLTPGAYRARGRRAR